MEMFRTNIELKQSRTLITHSDSIMLLGSCFAENIGNKLESLCFDIDVNPFGIVYNPLSVSNSLKNLLNKKFYDERDLFFYNEVWNSFDHHSKFSNTDKTLCIEIINNKINESAKFLQKAQYLFITFGTAFIYSNKKDEKVVSNCHKLPASNFNRILLKVNDIVTEYNTLIDQIKQKYPSLKIVFTISPVRHWKDGAEQNNLSKSILKVSINEILKLHPKTSYFPAYEIMMDDLRDYRFYNDDMLHPNNLAIEYIWNKFIDVFINEKTQKIIGEIEKINKAANHRPFNRQGDSYKQFLSSNLKKIEDINKNYPEVNTNDLKQKFIL